MAIDQNGAVSTEPVTFKQSRADAVATIKVLSGQKPSQLNRVLTAQYQRVATFHTTVNEANIMIISNCTGSTRWNLMSVLLLFLMSISSGAALAQSSQQQVETSKLQTQSNNLVKISEQQFSRFNSNQYWDSVKTTTGIAKAILIVPKSHQLGFVLGAQWGRGILLARKEQQWSAPVFVKFNSVMFGLLAGAQKVEGIGVILSNDMLNQISSKPFRVGATADLTIAKGISGKVVGGKDGISTLMVSENSGLFFGGSIDAITFRPDSELNTATYGSSVNIDDILSHKIHPDHPQSANLRNMLETAAFNAVYQ
ncbi:lipid-binding SYLF domain-containing protein [Vibrio sinaloensis]|uniref:lipid-binding SYLF domain-containing protein n=1 Tax=Photobacterium sp. (strain ATCC 43367) TaxID=379097 RepID=UPI0020532F9F|nr:lipid-binding SYLF domain-containing protein [Vibrio sinaloensis]UPQ89457.1 lipid-binding SYLF domain-containing protein [Vibrio sinaloensis]